MSFLLYNKLAYLFVIFFRIYTELHMCIFSTSRHWNKLIFMHMCGSYTILQLIKMAKDSAPGRTQGENAGISGEP